MNMIAHQFSESISRAQKGHTIGVKSMQITSALGRAKVLPAFNNTGMRLEPVNSEKMRVYVHGKVIETRADHVWHKTSEALMGRIRFFVLNDDESLGQVVFSIHFDSFGNLNQSYAFTDDAESQQDAIRDILIKLLNAVHETLDVVDL